MWIYGKKGNVAVEGTELLFYLCVIRYVQSYILTVTDVAVFDGWTRSLATHAHSWTHLKK